MRHPYTLNEHSRLAIYQTLSYAYKNEELIEELLNY